jgi:EAL domain-containing protein (putative c-di-GMP-specific phosphodiesterase class I)
MRMGIHFAQGFLLAKPSPQLGSINNEVLLEIERYQIISLEHI